MVEIKNIYGETLTKNEGIDTLKGADLSCLILIEADFRGQDLRGTEFVGAELNNADFSNANLEGADFLGADVSGAIFENANLFGAITSGCGLAFLERYSL